MPAGHAPAPVGNASTTVVCVVSDSSRATATAFTAAAKDGIVVVVAARRKEWECCRRVVLFAGAHCFAKGCFHHHKEKTVNLAVLDPISLPRNTAVVLLCSKSTQNGGGSVTDFGAGSARVHCALTNFVAPDDALMTNKLHLLRLDWILANRPRCHQNRLWTVINIVNIGLLFAISRPQTVTTVVGPARIVS
jgi:hypothetical protein